MRFQVPQKPALDVFGCRDGFQVIRVDAVADSAEMVYRQPFG